MNIVFAGTPAFALPCLEAVVASEHRLVGVLTQPDRPAGRGRRLAAPPVKERAAALDIAVQQPESLKDDTAFAQLEAWAPDLMVVVAYGLLLPGRVLALPRYGCINVHASLLPRWRGAAPIARALLAGDSTTGISLMHMDTGMDTGDVIARREWPIAAEASAGDLHDQLAELGGAELARLLAGRPEGLVGQAQNEADATYAPRLNKAEAALDWRSDALALARAVRAFVPWPVAHARLAGVPVRFWRAEALAGSPAAAPGTVVAAGDAGIDIATGAGILRIHELQLPGKRRTPAAELARGRDWTGQRFD